MIMIKWIYFIITIMMMMMMMMTCIPAQAFSMVASKVGDKELMQATLSSHLQSNDDGLRRRWWWWWQWWLSATRWMDKAPLWPASPCCHTSPWTNPPDSWSWFMMSIMMMVTMIVTWRSCWWWTSQEANRRWNPHSFLTLTFITMKYKAISDPLWRSTPYPNPIIWGP